MATSAEWLEGARLRTLPAAISPVIAGTGVALGVRSELPWLHTALALVVALALQVGVNYANDYSDGIRGTDDGRVGPQRLVGSGAASPQTVKAAAFASFGVAAAAGSVLVGLTGHLWLILVGLACILAAWGYTGGKNPYGYAGLGEVFVFIFFGLVAVCGTTFVLVGLVNWAAVVVASSVGALACAILVANNLRDVKTDLVAGKRTLATRLGDRNARFFYVALCLVAELLIMLVAAWTTWWVALGMVSLVFLLRPIKDVLAGATGKKLISVLKWTGIAELVASVGVFVGYFVSAV